MPGGFDIMFHVPDENSLVGRKVMIGQDFPDFQAFVPDPDVGLLEV